jgi:hypothetical protein
MAPPEVNKFTVTNAKHKEEEESPDMLESMIIRIISEIKEDMYKNLSQALVAHPYNLSYLGGRG